ncbi:MAG: XRE family transcriptional regulator [Spirochaetales bacterium]
MMGDRLRQRRLAVGMSLQQVADALIAAGTQITRATLSKYELEQSSPNALVLREIAKVFGVKTDYFFSETRTEVQWFAYRKRSSMSQADQASLQASAIEALERRVKAEERCGVEPTGLGEQNREQCETFDQAEDLAMGLRDHWGLDLQPIGSLIDLLESKGFVMIPLATGELKFDGLSGLLNGVRSVIVYKEDVVTDRLRFTVAHELAHHFLKADDPSVEEKLAHRFAAAFLMPQKRLRHHLGSNRTRLRLEELVLLKEQYGLSLHALVYRAGDAGIISDRTRTELFQFFGRMGMRRAEPGRYNVTEKPDELKRILLKGVAEGQITEAQATELDPEFPAEKERSQTMPTWDLRELLALPPEERDKVLEDAAASAASLYNHGGPLGDLEVLDIQ